MSLAKAAGLAIAVTDRSQVPGDRTLLDVVRAVLEGGAHGVLVRERDLADEERAALVTGVRRLCAEHDALLLVASPLPHPHLPHPHLPPPQGRCDRSRSASVDHIESGEGRRLGLHLRRHEGVPADLDRVATFVGRSCHDLAELRRAADDGLDHVTLSPVAASVSKPGHGPALGPAGLRRLASTVRREHPTPPVILALGGVDAANAGHWIAAGADGVAVMGAVMRAADPTAAMRAVVDSVRTARAGAS
ncbi:thiamine phosphate synthase [Intrasporangium calvum]|uniref:thiamine phosphate synthase n=1 Tax=Intrasporangium calvum TaxID=53358 RepID=UPI001901DEBF|nr:thiamine phosphate synthase [Intrasporangium calvum]